MQIWIDADACPTVIKDIVFRAAERLGIATILVANRMLRTPSLKLAWDRRVLTGLIGVFTTAVALTLDISQYTSFLYLIGGVFIPMAGALIGAWLRGAGRDWDTSDAAPSRPGMWLAWGVGFVVYQLINPGSVPGWADVWTRVDTALHTTGHVWLSASLTSFVVAAALAWFLPALGAGDRTRFVTTTARGPESGSRSGL